MKILVYLLGFSLLVSCTKEQDNTFRPYFKLKVNGKKETLNSCGGFLTGGTGGGEFSCEIIGDSILFLKVGCDMKAIFYIKDKIKNGTYQFDNINQAWYGNYAKVYRTSSVHKGTLAIEISTFQAFGLINTIKGQFSFNAIDTASGQTINVTDGEFFMQRYNY
jgi:hypothetical protein